MRPLDVYLVLKAVHQAGYDWPGCVQWLGDAYVERCAGLVHRSRPRSYRRSHKYASRSHFRSPCVGAWVDVAPPIMARGDTLPPPYPPEDTPHLAYETIPAHE